MKVQFKDWLCELQFKKYNNGRTAIQLIDSEDGCPIATATVNLPDEHLEDDEVFIKDYSENEGILQTLIDAGIVDRAFMFAKAGFVSGCKCKLLRRV